MNESLADPQRPSVRDKGRRGALRGSTDCQPFVSRQLKSWLRGRDLNPRPLGYEPNELPDCSTPRHRPLYRLVGLGRFELPTSRLSGVRSNQLSYRPAVTLTHGVYRKKEPHFSVSAVR